MLNRQPRPAAERCEPNIRHLAILAESPHRKSILTTNLQSFYFVGKISNRAEEDVIVSNAKDAFHKYISSVNEASHN